MNAHLRRGACPGLWQPMATGDGLLARMTPTGATMSCQAFAALCIAARSCGNGVIEITSRGSLQIRGLTESSAQRFATAVGSIELPFCEGPPVLINPLAGLDPDEALDMSAIATELRRALAAADFSADIGPKVSIALDGGGVLHLDAVAADVRMRTEAGGACLVAVAGDAESATPLGGILSRPTGQGHFVTRLRAFSSTTRGRRGGRPPNPSARMRFATAAWQSDLVLPSDMRTRARSRSLHMLQLLLAPWVCVSRQVVRSSSWAFPDMALCVSRRSRNGLALSCGRRIRAER